MNLFGSGIFALLTVQVALSRSVLRIDQPNYLIVSPRVYHPGTTAKLSVDIFGSRSCNVEVRLLRNRQHIVTTGRRRFTPGKHGELELKIPQLSQVRSWFRRSRQQQIELKIQSFVCGKRRAMRTIILQRFKDSVFIQADKPIYKPGQKIRMRIISVSHDLKPVGNEVSSVTIQEPSGSKIMQWNKVKLQDGIASLELPLSKEPVLGEWTIKAVVGKISTTQVVEVAKYVLPKFEVVVKPPPYMAFDQNKFTTSICARYTYGKSVKGKLNAVLCLKHEWVPFLSRRLTTRDYNCHNITKEIDGCTDITLTRDDLKISSPLILPHLLRSFNVKATVIETLTGIKLSSKEQTVNMIKRSTVLDLSGVPNQFKPGLSFYYTLRVTHPDETLISGAKVRVVLKNNFKRVYEQIFTVKNGIITEEIKDMPYDARETLSFEANVLEKSSSLEEIKKTVTIRAWISPSRSYLQVSKAQNVPAKVGSNGLVIVRYTVANRVGNLKVDFYYNIMCKGNIVHSGQHSQYHQLLSTARFKLTTVVEQFEIKFPVIMKMVPKCRILVYYVRADKETVADSIMYDVEDLLENQVSVAFSDHERKPGEKTKLILKATPGSRVAFAAVDKSVSLLKAGNELTKDKIIHSFEKFDGGRSWNSNDKCNHGWYWRGKRSIIPWGYGSADYEDASAAFNGAGVVFLTNLNIFTKPCPRIYPMAMRFDSGPAGVGGSSEGTGTTVPIKVTTKQGGNEVKKTTTDKPVRIRKEFPETWLWADEKLNETSGEKTIEVTVPDSITTWIANGFAMSSTAGIGVSAKASIKAFQPFFVQMTLPYSVVRGEEIPVTITVFNYMSSCIPIKLELNKKSPDYKVLSYHVKKLCVCGDAGHSEKFIIIPTNLGHIPLTVIAQTSSAKLCPSTSLVAADAVTRKLLVEPEGIRQEYTKGTFFCAKDGEYKEEFDLSLPRDIVPGSVYPTVSLIGDVMGPALTNLDGLLRMPYGCGEQNMAKFAPNIYIMDYLTKTNQVNKEIKDKAETFMRSGYQRELTYKRRSGSYSAFGNSDRQGSMMLTAFVVRSFARAKNYIFVDEEQVEHSIRWFQGKQLGSGCFPNYGKVFSRTLQGGLKSELTITAYVTIALLEAGQDVKSSMVSRALTCIVNQTDTIKDSYTTALVAYTLALANHSKASDMINTLMSKAITKGDQMYWSASSAEAPPPIPYRYYYYRTPSADVEMTGYALLAIMKNGMSVNVIDIVRWLSKQRNSYGGFSSTQDTCVALQALAEFAGIAYGNNADFKTNGLRGNITIKNAFSHDFTINDQNRLVLQRVEIPGKLIPNKLQFSATGAGCALLQTSVKYNIPTPIEIPAFAVNVLIRRRRSEPDEEKTACEALKLIISTKWLKKDVSNMAVVDVKLVSGFTVREESLERLKQNYFLNFKRYDIEGQNVMLYFDEIKDMTFSIDIIQSTLIKKLKPAVVRVYDYYDPENEGKVMYNIHEKECYGSKLISACPKCTSIVDKSEELINATINCSSYVGLVKSKEGLFKISKSLMNLEKQQKMRISYEIPEFCQCDEINNELKSLMIGKSSYFKKTGNETIIVLNSETTIIKWTVDVKEKMENKIRKFHEECKHGNT